MPKTKGNYEIAMQYASKCIIKLEESIGVKFANIDMMMYNMGVIIVGFLMLSHWLGTNDNDNSCVDAKGKMQVCRCECMARI